MGNPWIIRQSWRQSWAFGVWLILGAGVLGFGCASKKTIPKHLGQETPKQLEDLVRSDFSEGELLDLCKKSIDRAQQRLDLIAKSSSISSFEATVMAFEESNSVLSDETTSLSFMKYVSTNEKTHSDGAACELALGEYFVRTFGRRDLYNVLKAQTAPDRDGQRLLEKTLEAFESNGLKLSDENLSKVTALFSKLNDLQTSFSNHLNNDNSRLELLSEELEGATEDFLAQLKKTEEGKFIVTAKVTDYSQVMENVKSEETRRKMLLVYTNRQGVENTKLLEEALLVRQQIATQLGFKSWADYQLSHGRMAKSSSEVLSFIDGLKQKLAARNQKDIDQLLEYKKTGDPEASEVKAWDISYLSYQLKKRDFSLDDEEIKEYFPSDLVVTSMFELYSKLLGIRFQEVKDVHTWSPDVKLYRVLEGLTGEIQDSVIGYFYTDFIPRHGKFEHFAAFTILGGRLLKDGSYQKPVSAIVGNFNPPSNGKPSLLNHDDVLTVFHEFGHIMHQTLTKAPFTSLSGSNVAQDFVEAPSQMLENWPWQEQILDVLSGHYTDPSRKLPQELLKKMIAARDYQQGYHYTRQLMLALTDMDYHTASGPVDSAAIYNRNYKELLGVDPIEGGHFAAGFGHLMGGYDAGYYGYLWSEVYAADMFSLFEGSGVSNSETGQRYRKTILERGNMENAQDLLTQFLGRPSNNEAFLRKLHIEE